MAPTRDSRVTCEEDVEALVGAEAVDAHNHIRQFCDNDDEIIAIMLTALAISTKRIADALDAIATELTS